MSAPRHTRPRTVMLGAGGTGGHVFPAQALARELGQRGLKVVLVTDSRRGGGYAKYFPGVEIRGVLAASPTGGGLIGKLKAALLLGLGTIQAWALVRRLKPAAFVGFGGFPSLPPALAASLAGVPVLIHEQNAYLGRVNRLLSGRAAAIAASFPGTRGIAAAAADKVTVTGNPVRDEITALTGVAYERPAKDGPLRLLILGGSQGALILSQVVPAALAELPAAMRARLEVVQQCREEDLDDVRKSYRASGIKATLASFIEDVPDQLKACHLAIARAGASTVSELAVAGRPSILVPYAFATDDHQSANANALVEAGGAWVMPQDKFTIAACARTIEALLEDPLSLEKMSRSARDFARPDAAKRLADLVESLLAGHGNNGDPKTGAANDKGDLSGRSAA